MRKAIHGAAASGVGVAASGVGVAASGVGAFIGALANGLSPWSVSLPIALGIAALAFGISAGSDWVRSRREPRP